MPKIRLLLVLVVAATAAAVLPGTANADTLPITHTCSPGPCGAWHDSPVTVTYDMPATPDPGSDASCQTGPFNEPGASFTCTATFNAGADSGSDSVVVLVDQSAPGLAGAVGPDRPPDFNGWYNHAVTFGFPWADGLSGLLGSCETGVTYNGASGTGRTVTSNCRDNAGNGNSATSPAFNFDAGGPTGVAGAPARPADHSGWYNHAVAVAFTGADPTSGISSCTSTTYAGPDSAAAAVPGSCTNGAGLTTQGPAVVLQYDDGAPAVTGATADRPPDSNGWYNHPVAFAFHGSDSASGIAGCSSATYSGPDDSTASLKGTCSDNAGNSASRTIAFKFDEHAPDASKLFTIPANKSIDLSWSPPGDAASFTITRTPAVGATAPTLVYQGSGTHFVDTGLDNGKKYNYVLTTLDAAGNGRITGKSAVPDGSSLRPFIDTEVGAPPRLSWGKVRRARYYNLQLFKGRKKILSTWPKRASLKLKSSWKYNGKKIKLTSGLYRWYVWPGYGSMKRHKYGNLVGSSTFRLVK